MPGKTRKRDECRNEDREPTHPHRRDANRDDRSNDDTANTPASRKRERWGHALAVLFAPFALAFTGCNFWRLATEGEIHIRYQGRFVPPDYSLYFWVTLLFYIVIFIASAIVLLLFLGWIAGTRGRGAKAEPEPTD